MHTITAVIRCKKGSEETMRQALLAVADNVNRTEPETVGFFVSQDEGDPCLFTTYERFVDEAAMDRHNTSDASKQFFVVAKPIIEGEVVLVKAREVSAKT